MYYLQEENFTKEEDTSTKINFDRELLLIDRCDSCSAQAFVIVEISKKELLFCGHHFSKHQDALSKVATKISDQRYKINAKPSISANAE